MNQHFDTDLIKSQIGIVSLISKDQLLQKHGDTYRSGHESKGHGSKSKTCPNVCLNKPLYLCLNSGQSGNPFSWGMHRDRRSFVDAAKWLCWPYHLPLANLSPKSAMRLESAQKERKPIRPILKVAFGVDYRSSGDALAGANPPHRLFSQKSCGRSPTQRVKQPIVAATPRNRKPIAVRCRFGIRFEKNKKKGEASDLRAQEERSN